MPREYTSKQTICHPDRKHRAHGLCKACYTSKWAKEHKLHIKATAYGMTEKEVINMYEMQNGKCAICLKDIQWKQHGHDKVCIDHHHITNKVRGLLCDTCNKGLGFYEKLTAYGNKLTQYLKKGI
jgi:hypothetical protein